MLISGLEAGFMKKDADDIKTIRVNIEGLRNTINELTEKIFKGDSSIALRKALYCYHGGRTSET